MSIKKTNSGITLIEIMVSMAILTAMALVLFSSMNGMLDSQGDVKEMDEINLMGAASLNKMFNEMQSAFIVKSQTSIGENSANIKYAFIGREDRVNFVAFAHRRYFSDQRESDIAEFGYSLSPDPENSGVFQLIRREAVEVDADPENGGKTIVIASQVKSLSFEYFESRNAEYLKSWDTLTGNITGRLPRAVKVSLALYRDLKAENINDEGNLQQFQILIPIPLYASTLD